MRAGRPTERNEADRVFSLYISRYIPFAPLFAAICLPCRSPLSPNYSNMLVAFTRSGLQAKYTPSHPISS